MKSMIGLSSTYYAVKGFSLYESVKRIVSMGFEVVELGAAHSYEEDIFYTLEKIKETFPETIFTIHGMFPPLIGKHWFNPADGISSKYKQIIDGLFRSADIIGAKIVSIHPPISEEIVLADLRDQSGFWEEKIGLERNKISCSNNYTEVFSYMNSKASNLGIKIAIENLDNLNAKVLISLAEEYKNIFRKFSSFGFLLDYAHSLLYGNLWELMKLNKYLLEIHLHNIKSFSNGRRAAHYAINDISYVDPIKNLIKQKDLPIILEHGIEVSEAEIIREREMLIALKGDQCAFKEKVL